MKRDFFKPSLFLIKDFNAFNSSQYNLSQVFVDGFNIEHQLNNPFDSLGYCPQSDGLWEDITIREHLKCYSRIKGVPMNEIKGLIERYIFKAFSCKFLWLQLNRMFSDVFKGIKGNIGKKHIYNFQNNFSIYLQQTPFLKTQSVLFFYFMNIKHLFRYGKVLKITDHLDKRIKQCSGGTKRKLSFLISMIGNYSTMIMDEPSRGMDPSARRFLW